MAKFVAVKKHGTYQVVYRTVIGEGFPPDKVVEKIKETEHSYSGQQQAEEAAARLNQELFPTHLVVPLMNYSDKTAKYMVGRVKRNKDGQAIGRELCELVYDDAETARCAITHNLRWTKDCLANRQPVALVNGVRILTCTKQRMKMMFWYRALLPNGRLMDFDARKLAVELERVIEIEYGGPGDQRKAINRLWESIRPSFDLAGWIEQNGNESYLCLDR